jgi:hypothetical protein
MTLVSTGGCITSALTESSAVEVWVRSWGLSAAEQDEVWARWRRGQSLRLIARRLGKRPTLSTGTTRSVTVSGSPATMQQKRGC